MSNDAYQIAYRTMTAEAARSERSRAFGDDDIGQHSWTTPRELRNMISSCELNEESVVLDVGCGAGGPAMFIARQSGCRVTGLDIDEQGVSRARSLALENGLSDHCRFEIHDAGNPFEFTDCKFDLVYAIDSVFHIPRRNEFLLEAMRILKPGGKLFFTDAGVVNGQISGEEFRLRSFNGPAFYAPAEYNPVLLEQAGFEIISIDDLTGSNEIIARRRYQARVELEHSLVEVEGEVAYQGRQTYLNKVAELCQQRRLCRFGYLAGKADTDQD